MKLIFPADSVILNELLGFVDADIDPSKIKSDLFTATKELIGLVGREAYEYAVKLHEKEQSGLAADPQTELSETEAFHLYHFRYPIAVNAYREYVPSGDLSHTNNGRKMRNDEHEKAAFEWMINRDNESLEKRYYKALDNLLDLLDDENPVFVAAGENITELKWKGTEAFQQTHRLFVRTTKDFDEYFPIHSRLLLLKLQPGLAKCEREEILPRIGKEKNTLLKDKLKGTNQESEPDADLLALVKEACVFYALAWAVRRLRVSLLPDGILQRYMAERINTIATKVPEKMEAELTAQSFTADAEKVLRAIESYVAPPPTPEELEEGNVHPGFDFDDCDNFIST